MENERHEGARMRTSTWKEERQIEEKIQRVHI